MIMIAVPLLFCMLNVSLYSITSAIILDEEAEKILKDLLREFDSDPKHARFDHVVSTSHLKARHLPKMYIWCPMRHRCLPLKCPLHGCELRIGHWTDVLDSIKPCPRNPRLIYDLHGNSLLIQAFYECTQNIPGQKKKGHMYLSASSDILNMLPADVLAAFPIILQQRCAFTKHLFDYILSSIYQGQNFMELSDGISMMNFQQFVRNNPQIKDYESCFQGNIFCSSPSNDKLIELFLSYYKQTEHLYEKSMQKKTAKLLTFDHTFKTAKYIGTTRDDGAFVRQYENVYLALNENGEVLAWRYTKSTSGEEVLDLLKKLKMQLDAQGSAIDMVIVDDCCHTAKLYQEVFPEVEVKLDLFHACARITQTIPKKSESCKDFMKEFSLIFRHNRDLDQDRTLPTPSPEDIESNLERLLFSWREKLPKETLHQIDILKERHINKGCLSGIPPGCGTEKNERLHRHLNRSMLCGVSKIGPELAVAIMACCLYVWNCKRSSTFHRNRSVPVPPVDITDNDNCLNDQLPNAHMKIQEKEMATGTSKQNKNLFPSIMKHLHTETVYNIIIQRTLHLEEFVMLFQNKCQNRAVSIIQLLWSSEGRLSKFVDNESNLNTIGIDMSDQQEENMQRNLSGLNLELDLVAKDGNCFFSAVAKQLSKHLPDLEPRAKTHIEKLGLGNLIEHDTKRLRTLFVDEIEENLSAYAEWIPINGGENNVTQEILNFRADGYFASDIGDICAKAISTVLQIPLIVVTSFAKVPTIPFIPQQQFSSTKPIYIVHNHTGPGHYDATNDISSPVHCHLVSEDSDVRCTCGKNGKRQNKEKSTCMTARCVCHAHGKQCTRKCRCRVGNCQNKSTEATPKADFYKWHLPNRGCSCGKANSATKSCSDSERKSKCPCVIQRIGCTEMCRCYNCANVIGAGGSCSPKTAPSKRRRETVSPYTKIKSSQFLMESGSAPVAGPWTLLETLCLIVCKELLCLNGLPVSSTNLKYIYNFVGELNKQGNMSLPLSEKSTSQVAAKILYHKS